VKKNYLASIRLSEFPLWAKMTARRPLFSFDFDLTARCNNDCRHCYINLPAGDRKAKAAELTLAEIDRIAGEAAELGAFWCLLSGGEPLLREDFEDVYLLLKKKGLLVSVFTNATLIREKHVKLFKAYPPRDVEVSVYGATLETYEGVTRNPGSFAAFMRGLELLRTNGIKVRMKAMALRSNVHEFAEIAALCRSGTKDYFRFDPFLHLRYDGDRVRNEEIRAERLTPEEIVALEKADTGRFLELEKKCRDAVEPDPPGNGPVPLFHCGAGQESFSLGYDGTFRLCPTLWHPECIADLRKKSLKEAWTELVPAVRGRVSENEQFYKTCPSCPYLDYCQWCPAKAHLESGRMDVPVDYFCGTSRARAAAFGLDKGT
jgi:radical SAM protein with 4Fe4S-binding SPASM domain